MNPRHVGNLCLKKALLDRFHSETIPQAAR